MGKFPRNLKIDPEYLLESEYLLDPEYLLEST